MYNSWDLSDEDKTDPAKVWERFDCDRIVTGITSKIVRKHLLKESDLTLAKAIQICQVNELTEQQVHQTAHMDTGNICMKDVPGDREVNVVTVRKKTFKKRGSQKYGQHEKQDGAKRLQMTQHRSCAATVVTTITKESALHSEKVALSARNGTISGKCADLLGKYMKYVPWTSMTMKMVCLWSNL